MYLLEEIVEDFFNTLERKKTASCQHHDSIMPVWRCRHQCEKLSEIQMTAVHRSLEFKPEHQ